RALDAALARVGVARREVYPRLQIEWANTRERTAIVGQSASPQVVLGYGVSLTLPILDGGRIRANIAVNEAKANEAMAEYEKAMLAALSDVEVALAQWSTSEASLAKWQQAQ
ncbi:TolC family protein, partial [Chromohalobacter sp. HP20-39]